ncbi:MAG: Unknown protein [uncultured Sulfurovum sp.]|uniref:Uncharacterized protein n=1 Tax=uncultured Sulfurovum sp. TaxID=269237 RepID=A0A6S6U2X8_9BACT|nr:MAG: Unknown protein [uncultured Sulfurovum sp.]
MLLIRYNNKYKIERQEMKIITIVGLLFPLLYTGCGESEKKVLESTVIEEPNKTPNESLKTEMTITKKVEELDFLRELGFDIQNEKISFDINKTTNFIKQMEIEMDGKADEIQHKIEKADINFTRDMGISLEGEKIEIDLNRTRKMFQQINILMKEVLLDVNSSKH